MKFDITTIGDAFEDVFVEPDINVKYDRSFASGKGICFEFGEKIPLNSVQYEVGGSACNIAVGMSRLDLKTNFVTAIGEDSPAEKIRDKLINENVATHSIIQNSEIKTGFSVIFSVEGERTIFAYHALKDYSKLKLKKNLQSYWIFLTSLGENTDEIEKNIIANVAEESALFAWNPGSIQISKGATHYRHLLKCTSILFLNREEAIKFANFSDRPEIHEVMKKLSHLGPKIVVVTNGKEGACAYDGQEFYDIKSSAQVQRVDSTGAGDAFATGFLGKLIKSDWKNSISPDEIKDALKWGIKNSESVIAYIGAQKGLLDKTEIAN